VTISVVKRDGRSEVVQLDKITRRLEVLARGLSVEPLLVAKKVIDGLYDGVTTRQLDELAEHTAANLVTTHPDYDFLAARIAVSILHKDTPATYAEAVRQLAARVGPGGKAAPGVSDELVAIVADSAEIIERVLNHQADYDLDYLGINTLKKGYLLKVGDRIVERPQYMWMRVALGIHGRDLPAAFETYRLMSAKYFTHATPTLFNAGTPRAQMSSCFLLHMHEDSIPGIYKTLTDCALISQWAGGIGLNVHNIRAAGSPISGTNGTSNGLVPMLKNFDATASYCDQGGGKRKGSFAIYLEPWHADIEEWLDLKLNTGKEELRCRNLFYGLWVPDLFMRRVEAGADWTLMDPQVCPGLSDHYGEAFDALYERYEAEGKGMRVVKAQDLWRHVLDVQMETSMPYITYKDAANRCSNQKNIGIIKGMNLCTEVTQVSSPQEVAVCNLASVSLPAFVRADKTYDFLGLHDVVGIAVRNLNKVIDRNYYPVPEARVSNMRHRPIGIGVQGLADVFMRLGLEWESPEAAALNDKIFECVYHGALAASMELARRDGSYESFAGSPASQGLLQYDLYGKTAEVEAESEWQWPVLKGQIIEHGLRNSLLVALMPTASTANILDNTEGFEPLPSNIYKRNVLSGEFVRINRHLVKDLLSLGLWNDGLKQQVIAANGSVQDIPGIPEALKRLYKTVWEIRQKSVIDMAAARQKFVCQSQSMNVYMADPTIAKLTSMHFYGWRQGLKTGSYYIRQQSARQAQKVTVAPAAVADDGDEYARALHYLVKAGKASVDDLRDIPAEEVIAWARGACRTDDPDGCTMCGS
jgi:ribonucleoside-diphosphate reductase alpha subunit